MRQCDQLRALRDKHLLTTRMAAKRMGVSHTQWRKWEGATRTYEPMPDATYQRFLAYLGEPHDSSTAGD